MTRVVIVEPLHKSEFKIDYAYKSELIMEILYQSLSALVILANMPVRCNRRKNYLALIQNDNMNGTYLFMLYPL